MALNTHEPPLQIPTDVVFWVPDDVFLFRFLYTAVLKWVHRLLVFPFGHFYTLLAVLARPASLARHYDALVVSYRTCIFLAIFRSYIARSITFRELHIIM